MIAEQKSVRTFISYSWSSPAHEKWVLDLATQLTEDGVDIILDKWDLREGHDAVAFMEKMVTDPSVKKVIVISDRIYAEKADKRKGGVGTETQIISAEVYGKANQDKFCAVLSEIDPDGKPYLPTYYKSRIFIDLSNDDIFSSNYEQLLRWVFDKPSYPKPSLGKIPAFLAEDSAPLLPVNSKFRRAIDALRQNTPAALGYLEDYLDSVSSNFEALRIQKQDDVEFDDLIIQSIENFIPYRNELIEVFKIIARHDFGEPYINALHRFFERLSPYLQRQKGISSWTNFDFDNYRFIVSELYLYAVGILIQSERFVASSLLINSPFYVEDAASSGNPPLQNFSVLTDSFDSFVNRNQRLKLNRASLRADLIEQRSHTSGVNFRYLMQADFVLFIQDARASLQTERYQNWWPDTLAYIGRMNGPFEIFARAESKKYFDRIKTIFEVEAKDDFASLYAGIKEGRIHIPRFGYTTPDPKSLMNFEKLASRP